MPRKPTLSPTRIRTFLECQVRYRYIYGDRIGRFYQRARPEFSFGSTMHLVLQAFHAGGLAHSADELEAELGQRWISAGYETREQETGFRRVGSEAVRAYHGVALDRAARGIETYLTEKPITLDMDTFVLSGRVDRVDRHPDGALEVIDYKSRRTEVDPADVAGSLAMNVYQLILRRAHPDARVFATIHCLRSGVSASAEMGAREADEFEADVRDTGQRILAADLSDVVPTPIPDCDDCDFRTLCDRYWRSTQQDTFGG